MRATLNKLTSNEAAYIAGLFDGEGSLYANGCTLKITQGERGIQVLHYVKDKVGAGTITVHRAAIGNWQTVYSYRLQTKRTVDALLAQLQPYLLIKNQ